MISVKDVWKTYGQQEVLKGLSLFVPRETTMVILGRSGTGKSVLLRQIIGLEQPDRGAIWIDGKCLTHGSPAHRRAVLKDVGMLFQSSALFDSLTVGENVAFYLQQHKSEAAFQKLNAKTLASLVDHALELVGLPGYAKKMPAQLSGGQKRRAALARLIIYEPRILLFDEPTTGLDPITAMQINSLIAETVHRLKATAILVTHDLNCALTVGDYFALHHEGKIAYVDEKQAFLQKDDTLVRTFLEQAMLPANKLTTNLAPQQTIPAS